VVILFDYGSIVRDKYFFSANNRTNGGARWQFDVANRSANNLRGGFVTVSNGFDRFSSAAT
jgi:hypothetical protein